ncbi:MAG: PH domain-containing protein, partial [Candidatus Ranarchaeia archaeon]
MKNNINRKVIKPPTSVISSGKVFKPSSAFRNKIWYECIIFAFLIWGGTMLTLLGISGIMFLDDGVPMNFFINIWFLPVNFWIWVFNTTWLVPALILTPLYISRIEYSVLYESGESLPEIYVKKGIIQVTRKHVPFRTITNISAVAGPFDRIFGIGSVNIQTAGYSGAKAGPEEKLEGIAFYEEVRDFILQELRKFRAPYTTTTETINQEGV